MKQFTFFSISILLAPSLVFGQAKSPKNGLGFSFRPSVYKNHEQFSDNQMFDLAPAIHYERYTSVGFFAKVNLQFRHWQKEFEIRRSHSWVKTAITNRRFMMLNPSFFIGWRKNINPKRPMISPFINLGFAQHIQIQSRVSYPFSNVPEARNPSFESIRPFRGYYVIGAGLIYPIRKKWNIFVESQLAKPIRKRFYPNQYDAGLTIGTTYQL